MKLDDAKVVELLEGIYYIKYYEQQCKLCGETNQWQCWLVQMCSGLFCNHCHQRIRWKNERDRWWSYFQGN